MKQTIEREELEDKLGVLDKFSWQHLETQPGDDEESYQWYRFAIRGSEVYLSDYYLSQYLSEWSGTEPEFDRYLCSVFYKGTYQAINISTNSRQELFEFIVKEVA